ncbi:MAG: hypothetical protein AAF654_02410 [Myxococcota bacterium]
MNKRSAGFLAVLTLTVASGCGKRLNMELHYNQMRANLVSGNYAAADEYVKKQKVSFYGKKNRVLYYMNRGMILHLGEQYKASNDFLDKAELAAQDLWTESIRDITGTFLATDNSAPYQGEDFEKVAINIMSALNYVGMGKFEAAQVEARQVTNQLELYTDKYAEVNDEAISNYRDDAFARWLSGKMRALEGTYEAHNEAWIEYKKALKVYEQDYAQRYQVGVPAFVVRDALYSLEKLGADFREEFQQVRGRYSRVKYSPMPEGAGEIVVIHLNGEAPYKVDRYWDAMAGSDPFRVAYPEFVAKVPGIVGARVSASNGSRGRTEVGEPWTAIAIQNLQDHMASIKAKAIARGIAKYIAAKAAQEAGKEEGGDAGFALWLAGAIFQGVSYAQEEADKRSWVTLPAAINVASIRAPAGATTVQLEFVNRSGTVVGREEVEVNVQAGKTQFVLHRTYR